MEIDKNSTLANRRLEGIWNWLRRRPIRGDSTIANRQDLSSVVIDVQLSVNRPYQFVVIVVQLLAVQEDKWSWDIGNLGYFTVSETRRWDFT